MNMGYVDSIFVVLDSKLLPGLWLDNQYTQFYSLFSVFVFLSSVFFWQVACRFGVVDVNWGWNTVLKFDFFSRSCEQFSPDFCNLYLSHVCFWPFQCQENCRAVSGLAFGRSHFGLVLSTLIGDKVPFWDLIIFSLMWAIFSRFVEELVKERWVLVNTKP